MTLAAPAQRVWEAALGRLQVQVPRPTYDTWLRGTEGQSLAENILIVSAPSPFVAEWLQRRMHGLMRDAVTAVTGRHTNVSLSVATEAGPEVPLAVAPVPSASPRTPREVSPAPMMLNARYTLDSFVVGKSNRLAFAAASAVAESPGRSYNPLFLHGAVGLGKTHLLHAIGHQALAAGHRVRYVTCEQFTNEFTAAIRERRTAEFQARYRSLDVLLVDDIQFLCGKDGTQEAFFHTFNTLHGADRQVVVAADRPGAALGPLDERLRSRLEWGLVADLQRPDFETRVAILERHSALAPVPVPAEVISYLAEAESSCIRQLEGLFNRVTALAHFSGTPVTVEFARETNPPSERRQPDPADPSTTITKVATYFGVAAATLAGPRRDRAISQARQVAMFLLRQQGLRAERIGTLLGGRDRTTVAYALDRIQQRLLNDDAFRATLDELSQPLSS